MRVVAKRRSSLNSDLRKGFTMIFDQRSQEDKDKVEASDGWDAVYTNQSLHEIITKIERGSIGFNNHKQEVYNLSQSLWSKQ